jgi:hypothetical protein
VQQELQGIQKRLTSRPTDEHILAKMNEILVDYVAAFSRMELQISKLKSLFLALSTMIRMVFQNKVQKFIANDLSDMGRRQQEADHATDRHIHRDHLQQHLANQGVLRSTS